MEQSNSIKQETDPKRDSKEKNDIIEFTKAMHQIGGIDEQQVDAMQSFINGGIDYGTMRSMCG